MKIKVLKHLTSMSFGHSYIISIGGNKILNKKPISRCWRDSAADKNAFLLKHENVSSDANAHINVQVRSGAGP